MRPLPSSPAAVFLAFVAALLAAMLGAALLSPWVQATVAPIAVLPLHRVFARLTMLGVLAGAVWLLLRHGLARGAVLGYVGPVPRFLRRALLGLAAGVLMMAATLLPLFWLRVLVWSAAVPVACSGWLVLAAHGLGTGLMVALIEETFFRGAMQGALQRMGATGWALFAVPLLYAVVHFLGRPVGIAEAAEPRGGFAALGQFLSRLAHPFAILDAFVALWCVGVLLALVRRRWGDLAGCIGLHAGFVATITVFRKVSSPAAHGDWSFLVGSFDGLLGWWIAVLAGLACLLVRPSGRDLRA